MTFAKRCIILYYRIKEMFKRVTIFCLFGFLLEASEWKKLLQQCQKGAGSACTQIGYMYDKAFNLPKDDYQAVKYYSLGCELGDQRGCVNLGVMWEKEQANLKRDPKKIMQLFSDACEEEYGVGCYFLGLSYEEGKLVKKDLTKAYHYYHQACNLGVEEACVKEEELNFKSHK
ncbi:conserved hypothetical protein [Nitratiruptor sp. SB155-2]|nr:conserved hypothetical protein [Nitratiruptor sp. SB155-2]